MSSPSDEPTTGVEDEDLPEDLRPDEDNPLAEGLPEGETAGDLLAEGNPPEEPEDSEDAPVERRDEDDTDA